MQTFMFSGSYTSESLAAMVQKPQDRLKVVRETVESLGGKLEGFWLAFGEFDFVGISQLPNSQAAAAFSLAASSGGGLRNIKTVELLAWPDAMKTFEKAASAKYRSPAKT